MKTKKLFVPVVAVILLITACRKENDSIPSTPEVNYESGVVNGKVAPTVFTQKLLIEMFGTVHCGTCPDMEQKCRTKIANYPNRVYGYVAHNSDAMDFGMFDYLDSVYNVPTYSSGMLNRTPFGGKVVLAKKDWGGTNSNAILAKVANCGLQIASTINGTNATITVDAAFNATLAGNYNLTVLLYEDSVVGSGSSYNQSNYYNTIAGSLWFGLGNPMIGYRHDYVSRKVVSSSKLGDPIPAASIKLGGVFTKTYTTSISGYNRRNLYILAFVNKVGSTSTTHQVMNVQGARVGSTKLFD